MLGRRKTTLKGQFGEKTVTCVGGYVVPLVNVDTGLLYLTQFSRNEVVHLLFVGNFRKNVNYNMELLTVTGILSYDHRVPHVSG